MEEFGKFLNAAQPRLVGQVSCRTFMILTDALKLSISAKERMEEFGKFLNAAQPRLVGQVSCRTFMILTDAAFEKESRTGGQHGASGRGAPGRPDLREAPGDGRWATFPRLPYVGEGWYAKPAVAYTLEKGLATWRDSLDATAHVDQDSVTQALQQMEAAWPEGEEHYAKLSVNA
eukprot:s11847_g1.t1